VHPAIGGIDAAILVAYLAVAVALGVWIGRRKQDLAGYLLGGRSIPWPGLLLSIVATETSTVTFLSIPGVAFAANGSLVFLQLTFGYMIGRLLIVVLLLPAYFQGKPFTAYEVLHRRFGGAVGPTASVLFLVTRNLADGLRLYLTAIVMQLTLGVDLWLCIVVIGVTTIVYTFLGGLKSVVWNDCLQFVVYMVGAVLAAGVIVQMLPGGWEQLWQFGAEHGKFHLFDLSLDVRQPYTLWAGLVGGVFLSLGTHGADQLMVQRYLAARSRRDAAWALALSGPIVCGQFALFLLLGVGLACFYAAHPPAVPFAADDWVFARFIVDHLPTGVLGITLAAVFSAAMSTLSSSLNSSATAAMNDLYRPVVGNRASPAQLLGVSRALTVLFGLVQIGIALAGSHCQLQRSVVESVLAIAGFTGGPILGVFFLGIATRRVDRRGALAGLAGGIAVVTVVALGTDVAWPWFAVVGAGSTVAIGWVAPRSRHYS